MREFLVGEGPDQPLHHLDDLGCATERDRVGERRVFRVRPHLNGNRVAAVDHRTVCRDREFPGADDHRVGGNRVRLAPRDGPPFSVRHDAPILRCRHEDPYGRLVGRMIYGWDPEPCPLGPVVSERHAPASDVGRYDQSVARRPTVKNPDAPRTGAGASQREGPAIIAKRQPRASLDPQLAHAVDRHIDQVEPQRVRRRLRFAQADECTRGDRCAGVGNRDNEAI